MGFKASRLRSGEWIVGVSALVLLVLMFALPWYDPRLPGVTSQNGFNALTHLRWLVLITIAAGLALFFLQGARRAPALPVSFSVFVTVLGALTSLWMLYRVVIAPPSSSTLYKQTIVAYIGLLAMLVLTYGGFRSMREEEKADPARNEAIEEVNLGETH
jgi:hypothetical protein